MDFHDIKGQEHIKRGLEVATAGGHNVILIGPPNSGKAMLMARVPTIEPVQIKKYYVNIKTMEPCACGFFTDPKRACNCSPHAIQAHLTKEARRLDTEHVDIHLEVPRLNLATLSNKRRGESSAEIQKRTINASTIQAGRQMKRNADLDGDEIVRFCKLDREAEELLKLAILELGLSTRAYDKIMRVSRTIADLDGKETIEAHHISEAISYRSLDRNLWG